MVDLHVEEKMVKSGKMKGKEGKDETDAMAVGGAGNRVWTHDLLRGMILDKVYSPVEHTRWDLAPRLAFSDFRHLMLVNKSTFEDCIARIYHTVGGFESSKTARIGRVQPDDQWSSAWCVSLNNYLADLELESVSDGCLCDFGYPANL